MEQRLLVAVAEVAPRIEGAGEPSDDALRHVDHGLVGRRVVDLAEIGIVAAHLMRGAQRGQQHAVAAPLDDRRALAAAQHDAAHPDQALARNGVADDAERYVGAAAVGDEEIRGVEIGGVERRAVDEALEHENARGIDLQLDQVAVLDQDEMTGLDLVAAHDELARDLLAGLRIVRAHLHAVERRAVKWLESQPFGADHRRMEPDGTSDPGKRQQPLQAVRGAMKRALFDNGPNPGQPTR